MTDNSKDQENNQKSPTVNHAPRKTKYELTNETYNQLIKDFSAVIAKFFKDLFSVIKGAILLWISLFMATNMVTQVMAVYFENHPSHNVITGGSNNTIYYATPTTIAEPMLKRITEMTNNKEKTISTVETDKEETVLLTGNKAPEGQKAVQKILVLENKKAIAEIPVLYLSQEYPSSQGYNYTQSINLSSGKPAVMTFGSEPQGMWFGVGNIGFVNANNPTIFLRFDGKCEVIAKPSESLGWLTMDPNKQFVIKANGSLQPGSGFKLNPLFIKFPFKGTYKTEYTITSDNNLPMSGIFTINVV
jgi:hypothetical protein